MVLYSSSKLLGSVPFMKVTHYLLKRHKYPIGLCFSFSKKLLTDNIDNV